VEQRSAVAACSTRKGISWHSRFRDQQHIQIHRSPRRCRWVGVIGHHDCRRRTSSVLQCRIPVRCSGLSRSSSPGNVRWRPCTHRCRYLGRHWHRCHAGDGHLPRTPGHTIQHTQLRQVDLMSDSKHLRDPTLQWQTHFYQFQTYTQHNFTPAFV